MPPQLTELPDFLVGVPLPTSVVLFQSVVDRTGALC